MKKIRFKDVNEKRNYFLEKIAQNELMSRKHKKVCTTLCYIEHFLISRSLANSYIERNYFLLIDVLRQYNNMKEKNQ